MKILQITPYFPPHFGGLERFVYNLSKFLVKHGHEVEVLTSNIPRSKPLEAVDGIIVRRCHSLAEPLNNPIAPGFIHNDGYFEDFDIIHSHIIYSFANISALLKRRRYNIPTILTHHGQLLFGSPFSDGIVKIYQSSIEKVILGQVDHIVVLSPSDAQYFMSKGARNDKISFIPNAIDPEEFRLYEEDDPSGFLDAFDLRGRTLVLFVGQISTRKGVDVLLRAIQLVDQNAGTSAITFVLIGEGDYLKRAMEITEEMHLADGRVRFLGRVAFRDLIHAYRCSRLCVLPSISEGMPTVILEAMHFGLPVVTTSIPCLQDNFSESAILVPPRDERALADAILKGLEDGPRIRRLKEYGKTLVDTHYTWDAVAREYEEIYLRLKGTEVEGGIAARKAAAIR